MLRRILISICAFMAFAAPACAGTIVVQLTFVPGKLSASAAAATATPAAAVQVPITIADGRGSGHGWTLRVVAARNVTITRITARCAARSTCRLPAAATASSGKIVLQAARGSGMGVVNLVITVAALPSGSPATPLAFTIS